MKDINILTDYIAVWGWQLISVMFLLAAIILFSQFSIYITAVFTIVFLVAYVLLQFKTLKKRDAFYDKYR